MWWIIAIIVVIMIIGNLAESDDLLSRIMLFAGFLLILGAITSNFFTFMGVITEISGLVLIGSIVFKVFQKLFIK